MKFLIWAVPIVILLTAGVELLSTGSVEEVNLNAIKAEFNRSTDRTRVILLLSQSCPYCLKGATEIQKVLDKHKDAPVAVFTIWQPILPTDWARPRTHVLARLSDPRVRQYYDADHRVAAELGMMAGERQLDPECCWDKGRPWDLLAAFPPGVEWRESLPAPVVFKGTVEDAAPDFEKLLTK